MRVYLYLQTGAWAVPHDTKQPGRATHDRHPRSRRANFVGFQTRSLRFGNFPAEFVRLGTAVGQVLWSCAATWQQQQYKLRAASHTDCLRCATFLVWCVCFKPSSLVFSTFVWTCIRKSTRVRHHSHFSQPIIMLHVAFSELKGGGHRRARHLFQGLSVEVRHICGRRWVVDSNVV